MNADNPSMSSTPLPPPEPYTSDLRVQIVRYVAIAAVAAWTWDALINVRYDVCMFSRQRRPTLPDLVYILARIASGCSVWIGLGYNTLEFDNCETPTRVHGWAIAFTISLTPLLFIFRIYAIFHNQVFIKMAFSVLLFIVLAASIVSSFAISGGHIGTTQFCMMKNIAQYGSAGIVTMAVYDTLVCGAITASILSSTLLARGSSRMKVGVCGESIGHTASILVQSGLQYYCATIGISLCCAVGISIPSLPTDDVLLLGILPACFLINCMASQAYRQLKLNAIRDFSTASSISGSLHFRYPQQSSLESLEGIMPDRQGEVKPRLASGFGALGTPSVLPNSSCISHNSL